MSHPRPPVSRSPAFRPRFTLMMLYVAVLFLVYSLVLVLPELFSVYDPALPGPEQQERARQAAQEAASRTRLLAALLAAVVTVGAGAYARWLPGLRG